MNGLVFVGHRCNDHSPSSGYDQVCSLFPRAGWLNGRPLETGNIEWHREPPAGTTPRIFHVIYGDCSGKALPAILRERYPEAVIVSSAHQPVVRLKDDAPACAALRASDAIITMSEVQAAELRDFLGPSARIFPIPHGVWTHVFRPRSTPPPERTGVVMVGSFLRDWEGAMQVADGLARAGVRVLALGAGARKNLAADHPSIEVSPRITEDELAMLYERSAALFLPFVEATASNALLEAMCAGCPVICPRLPSLVEEYLGDDHDAFEPGRYDVAIARLLHHAGAPAERAARSRELMARVEVFDWARLAPLYAEVYEEVAAQRTPSTSRCEAGSASLPPAARQRLRRALLAHDGPVDGDAFVGFAVDAVQRLIPAHLLDACERVARGDGPEVALRIRGLPIDPELPPTPRGGAAHKPTHVSEAVIAGIAGYLGDLVSYRDEKDGELVQNVFPLAEEREAPSNSSSDVTLDLHTEIAFSRGAPVWRTYETSPDLLLLLCLRPAPRADALTRLVAADALLSRITSADRRILESPRFQLRAPYSFTRGGDRSRPWSEPVPLVHHRGRISFDLACGVRAIDEEAERALRALRTSASEAGIEHGFALDQGDLLVIDNRRAVHGRSVFAVQADGSDRWLQRVYVRRRAPSGAADEHEALKLLERQRPSILRL